MAGTCLPMPRRLTFEVAASNMSRSRGLEPIPRSKHLDAGAEGAAKPDLAVLVFGSLRRAGQPDWRQNDVWLSFGARFRGAGIHNSGPGLWIRARELKLASRNDGRNRQQHDTRIRELGVSSRLTIKAGACRDPIERRRNRSITSASGVRYQESQEFLRRCAGRRSDTA